jgi:hypothetical protein
LRFTSKTLAALISRSPSSTSKQNQQLHHWMLLQDPSLQLLLLLHPRVQPQPPCLSHQLLTGTVQMLVEPIPAMTQGIRSSLPPALNWSPKWSIQWLGDTQRSIIQQWWTDWIRAV